MSRHWKPEGDSARWIPADVTSPPGRTPWPQGATAGLVLVAASCLAVGMLLYQVAGPRDAVDENVAIGRDKVSGSPGRDSQDEQAVTHRR